MSKTKLTIKHCVYFPMIFNFILQKSGTNFIIRSPPLNCHVNLDRVEVQDHCTAVIYPLIFHIFASNLHCHISPTTT